MQTETVKIVNADHPEGWIIINKSEFNADEHKLYSDEDSDETAKPKKLGRPAKAAE